MGKRTHDEVEGEGGETTDGGAVKDESTMTREERRKMFWEQRKAAAEERAAKKAGVEYDPAAEAAAREAAAAGTAGKGSGGGEDGEADGAGAEPAEVSAAAQAILVRIAEQGKAIAALKQNKGTKEEIAAGFELFHAMRAEYKDETGEEPPKKKRQRGKKGRKREHAHGDRYLLFVGNLSFQTKIEHIYKHFGRFGGLVDVRLLQDKVTKKPKGTAFIEFDNQAAHGKALGLHHTKMTGRVINVELTVGGGGGGANRKEKLTRKNSRHLGTGGPAGINSIPLGPRVAGPK